MKALIFPITHHTTRLPTLLSSLSNFHSTPQTPTSFATITCTVSIIVNSLVNILNTAGALVVLVIFFHCRMRERERERERKREREKERKREREREIRKSLWVAIVDIRTLTITAKIEKVAILINIHLKHTIKTKR